MRIVVDPDLCEGHAQCCATAPDVFHLDESYTMRILANQVEREQLPVVEAAVAVCPRGALRLLADGETPR